MATRLERLILIDAYIRAGDYPSIERLCRLFEVQPRTVYQDLKDLKERFHLDIRFDRYRNGYFSANNDQRLPPMALTEDELILLLAGMELLCQSGGASFRGSLAAATEAVSSGQADSLITKLRSIISVQAGDAEISVSMFLSLLKACLRREPVWLSTNHCAEPKVVQMSAERLLFAVQWELHGKDLDGFDIIVPITHIREVRNSFHRYP